MIKFYLVNDFQTLFMTALSSAAVRAALIWRIRSRRRIGVGILTLLKKSWIKNKQLLMIEKKIITFLVNNYDIVEERLWERKRSSKLEYFQLCWFMLI